VLLFQGELPKAEGFKKEKIPLSYNPFVTIVTFPLTGASKE